MLRSLRELEGYQIVATDGGIGKVDDFYFDDRRWALRYLVVDCSGFLENRRVLISPVSFGKADYTTRSFDLTLTREKVKHSPDFETDKPVSRQYEHAYFGYYGWPHYSAFAGDNLWGVGEYPQALAAHSGQMQRDSRDLGDDPNLRSVREVTGYAIQGQDGEIGHVQDLIWDDQTWAIRYLVIDTSNWWTGKKVLVAPRWIEEISWDEHKVFVGLSRAEIKNSPEWRADMGVNRQYESQLYDYYGRPAYWGNADKKKKPKKTADRTNP